MKKNQILVFALLVSTLFACNKYEEGPSFSLKSAENRVEGVKTIVSYKVDGVDSTDYIFSHYLPTCENKVSFSKIQSDGYAAPHGVVSVLCEDAANGSGVNSRWNFANDNNTKVWFALSYALNIPPDSFVSRTFINSNIIWDIQKLTHEEIWLERENGKYELKFKSMDESL